MGFSEYTFRYLKADGTFSRVLVMQCASDQDAVHKAADHLDDICTALEVSQGDRIVWRGLKQDVLTARGSG